MRGTRTTWILFFLAAGCTDAHRPRDGGTEGGAYCAADDFPESRRLLPSIDPWRHVRSLNEDEIRQTCEVANSVLGIPDSGGSVECIDGSARHRPGIEDCVDDGLRNLARIECEFFVGNMIGCDQALADSCFIDPDTTRICICYGGCG